MVDAEAEKKRLSFKDALINKYSLDEDEELCFIQTIHISRSPEHKGEIREVQVSYYQIESECCFKEKQSEAFDGRIAVTGPKIPGHSNCCHLNGKTKEIWGHTWKSGKC